MYLISLVHYELNEFNYLVHMMPLLFFSFSLFFFFESDCSEAECDWLQDLSKEVLSEATFSSLSSSCRSCIMSMPFVVETSLSSNRVWTNKPRDW